MSYLDLADLGAMNERIDAAAARRRPLPGGGPAAAQRRSRDRARAARGADAPARLQHVRDVGQLGRRRPALRPGDGAAGARARRRGAQRRPRRAPRPHAAAPPRRRRPGRSAASGEREQGRSGRFHSGPGDGRARSRGRIAPGRPGRARTQPDRVRGALRHRAASTALSDSRPRAAAPAELGAPALDQVSGRFELPTSRPRRRRVHRPPRRSTSTAGALAARAWPIRVWPRRRTREDANRHPQGPHGSTPDTGARQRPARRTTAAARRSRRAATRVDGARDIRLMRAMPGTCGPCERGQGPLSAGAALGDLGSRRTPRRSRLARRASRRRSEPRTIEVCRATLASCRDRHGTARPRGQPALPDLDRRVEDSPRAQTALWFRIGPMGHAAVRPARPGSSWSRSTRWSAPARRRPALRGTPLKSRARAGTYFFSAPVRPMNSTSTKQNVIFGALRDLRAQGRIRILPSWS